MPSRHFVPGEALNLAAGPAGELVTPGRVVRKGFEYPAQGHGITWGHEEAGAGEDLREGPGLRGHHGDAGRHGLDG